MASRIIENDIRSIADQINTSGDGIPVVVFNQLSWERMDATEVKLAFADIDVFGVKVVDSKGSEIAAQLKDTVRYLSGGIKETKLIFIAKVPSMGFEVYRILKQNSKDKYDFSDQVIKSDFEIYNMRELDYAFIENEHYKVKFDLWTGAISSIVSKDTNEEFVNQEMPYCNMLVREQDNGDFWDINTPLRGCSSVPYQSSMPLSKLNKVEYSKDLGGKCVVEKGTVKSTVKFTQITEAGVFISEVAIYNNLRRIEINSSIKNMKKNVRYRMAFPANIKNGKIVHEIPFGNIERPEGEFPAQNWIDYSDGQKGFCILNCGLPGNAVMEDVLLLSLLKCTAYVSYEGGGFDASVSADGGYEIGKTHNFKYAIVPHSGTWKAAQLYKYGEELNNPLIVYKSVAKFGSLPARKSFVDISAHNVLVSCIKRDDKNVILRVYEAEGTVTESVKVKFGFNIKSVLETNLIEDEILNENTQFVNKNEIEFNLGGFEIKTFKIIL